MYRRIDYKAKAPEGIEPLAKLGKYLVHCGLEATLLELVRLRASQINGCAHCIDMHVRAARGLGEREDRLHGLAAWREFPFFTERERAALAWTEAVTLVASTHVPDEVYDEARRHFAETELVDLTLAIGLINVWNRLAIGFRRVPGS